MGFLSWQCWGVCHRRVCVLLVAYRYWCGVWWGDSVPWQALEIIWRGYLRIVAGFPIIELSAA